jgi:hypothetical protein
MSDKGTVQVAAWIFNELHGKLLSGVAEGWCVVLRESPLRLPNETAGGGARIRYDIRPMTPGNVFQVQVSSHKDTSIPSGFLRREGNGFTVADKCSVFDSFAEALQAITIYEGNAVGDALTVPAHEVQARPITGRLVPAPGSVVGSDAWHAEQRQIVEDARRYKADDLNARTG